MNWEEASKIKIEMDKRIKEIQSSQIYEMFAEKDEILRDLLADYKQVIG